MAYTISQGTNVIVANSGVPVVAIPAGVNGGIITNPYSAADQNVGTVPEPLYINPIGSATLNANYTTFALQPGESWNVIPGQTTPTSVNATTGGHAFTAIYW